MAQIISITYKPMHSDKRIRGFVRVIAPEVQLIAGYGIEGDRKGGHPKRQLNILSRHTLETLQAEGYDISAGAIGEQMVIDGIDVDQLPIGTRLQFGDTACVEITIHRTGCPKLERLHSKTDIRDDKPLGVMVKVVQGGRIHVGDAINLLSLESTICLNM